MKPEISKFFDTVITFSQISESLAIQHIYSKIEDWREDVDLIKSVLIHAPVDRLPSSVLFGLLTAARWMHGQVDDERRSLALRVRAALESRDLEPDCVNNCMKGLE